MQNRIIIITENDLVKYPPMQSMLQVLHELGKSVIFVGYCSDTQTQSRFESLGISFVELRSIYGANVLSRFNNNRLYRRKLSQTLNCLNIEFDDIIIYDYTDAIYYTYDLINKYRYIVLFYEFINPERSWKYRMLYHSYDIVSFLKGASGVIHCEYNRAQITKGLYNLDRLPFVLPNKPYIDETLLLHDIPDDILNYLEQIKKKTKGKKIILYQGVFLSNERRLEEFCQALEYLPDDFILVAMGGGSGYYDLLKEQYESDRAIFVPFIKPPYHQLITQLAYIGVLSYFPLDNTFAGVINPLFCAPNKIFEYSKYSIPMISNDLPGLKNTFENYKCGMVIRDPFLPEQIKDVILEITKNYQTFSDGALHYYNSVDIKQIISDILIEVENK